MSRAKRLKFPLLKGRQNGAPTDFKCPWCRKHRVGEPHSMAMLTGGLMITPKTKTLPNCYLNLTWHGGHYIEARPPVETYEILKIADDVELGFEVYFCSTACLRAYLNYCVDELEKKVRKAKPGTADVSIRELKRKSKSLKKKR